MTREEAKQNLVALGIENPTDAQVTNYLNQFHSNRNQPPAPAPTPNPAPAPNPQPSPQPTQQPNPKQDPQNEELQNALNRIAELELDNRRKNW